MTRYFAFHDEMKRLFGQRVDRITINAGFTCPNIDGTKARGGCVFCQDASYEGLTLYKDDGSVSDQIKRGIEYVKTRYPSKKFFAYFQNGTNTYAPAAKLKKLFEEALIFPEIAGLMISTRPDCITPEILDLLYELNQKTYLWVELGMPSHREEVNTRLNRAHTNQDFTLAVKALKNGSIRTCAHVMFGLPGEEPGDEIAKAHFMNEHEVNAVKLHNMVVFKDTALEKMFLAGRYKPQTLEEYTQIAVNFLENLKSNILIQRLIAHGPKRHTVAPDWSVNKWNGINAIHAELEKRETWQGKKLNCLEGDIKYVRNSL